MALKTKETLERRYFLIQPIPSSNGAYDIYRNKEGMVVLYDTMGEASQWCRAFVKNGLIRDIMVTESLPSIVSLPVFLHFAIPGLTEIEPLFMIQLPEGIKSCPPITINLTMTAQRRIRLKRS